MRRHLLIFLVLTSSVLSAWGFWLEPRSLRIHEVDLDLGRWPTACSGLKVALLSDLHVGSHFKGIDTLPHLVATTHAASPDLVLLAGDYIAGGVGADPADPDAIAGALTTLRAPLGVYAVMGNHDIWEGPGVVAGAFRAAGLKVLDDEAILIQRGECRFWLVGMSDYEWGAKPRPDVISHLPENEAVVVLTHNPDSFPSMPPRVALTLAGHTHGGQVRIPFIGRPIVPSRHGQRYAIGHIVEDGRHLYVSSGIGTSVIPVRLGVPPEVAILTLENSGSRPPDSNPSPPSALAPGDAPVEVQR